MTEKKKIYPFNESTRTQNSIQRFRDAWYDRLFPKDYTFDKQLQGPLMQDYSFFKKGPNVSARNYDNLGFQRATGNLGRRMADGIVNPDWNGDKFSRRFQADATDGLTMKLLTADRNHRLAHNQLPQWSRDYYIEPAMNGKSFGYDIPERVFAKGYKEVKPTTHVSRVGVDSPIAYFGAGGVTPQGKLQAIPAQDAIQIVVPPINNYGEFFKYPASQSTIKDVGSPTFIDAKTYTPEKLNTKSQGAYAETKATIGKLLKSGKNKMFSFAPAAAIPAGMAWAPNDPMFNTKMVAGTLGGLGANLVNNAMNAMMAVQPVVDVINNDTPSDGKVAYTAERMQQMADEGELPQEYVDAYVAKHALNIGEGYDY